MVGEPDRIRAVAARLRHEAQQVREVSTRVGAARGVEWRSGAADAFRERVSEAVHGERRAAQLLDEAARAVDLHAAAVERVLDGLAALVRAAQEAAGRLGH
ncbi:MAG TPA: hypothetical protein VGK60_03165 [Pedococcus sp.]